MSSGETERLCEQSAINLGIGWSPRRCGTVRGFYRRRGAGARQFRRADLVSSPRPLDIRLGEIDLSIRRRIHDQVWPCVLED